MVDAVSAAKLAIYLILAPLALYCLYKHGRTGAIGWLYISLLCTLRIITGAMGLTGNQKGEAAVILNSIGLSPLLLGLAGVLHEARRATNAHLHRKLEVFLHVHYHALTGASMLLIILPIVNVMSDDPGTHDKLKLDVGSAIFCVCWVLLVIWTATAFVSIQGCDGYRTSAGKLLLYAVSIGCVLVAVRLGYAITYLQLIVSHPDSEFLRSTPVQVCLSMVPEVLVIVVLLVAGIHTRNLCENIKAGSKA